MNIVAIIGARPQFIKHAPIELAIKKEFTITTIHTGQHYDENMSKVFFEQLKMSTPKYMLSVGSHGHGIQTGIMMEKIEPILLAEKPAAVIVYGDTNSTLAGALVAAKLHIPIIHIEAGLRSFNRKMPEEVNRVLTDHISSLLIAPTQKAVEHLKQEGIEKNVFHTGDIMCDMVHLAKEVIKDTSSNSATYYYATIHRPYNTDDNQRLLAILSVFNSLKHPVKFSLHPRTKKKIIEIGKTESDFPNIEFLDPVSYFDNIKLQKESQAIITDSGGIQKEAYVLKKQCITLRPETEWVETLQNGWNQLVFEDISNLEKYLNQKPGIYEENIYGDGNAAVEIKEIILNFLEKSE